MEEREGREPARPYVSWDRGTKQHTPAPVRPYLSRFIVSLTAADSPVPEAAATTAEDAAGCVTHTSNNTGHLGRYRRGSRAADLAGCAVGAVS